MFPALRHNILYAIDLDGVIIDSIEECFINSMLTYNGINKKNNIEKILFYKNRGLVGPAFQYYYLMKSIYRYINNRTL